jgi:hypothetical protein
MKELHHSVIWLRSSIGFIFSLSCVLVFTPENVHGQELQRNAFSFINVTPAARIGGLGGVNVSLTDRDPNTFLSNPSTISDSLSGFASVNYQFYVGDIGHAAFTLLPKIGRAGLIGIGVNHFSYGTIQGYDATGAPLSDFSVSETAIVLSKSHQVRSFRFGVSLKGAFSSLAGYRSSALMADMGGVFINPKENFQIGLVLKNVGFILSDYTETSESALPIDLQLGATIKPEHMPFRFSFTIYRLIQSKAVDYVQNQEADPSTLQQVFRHFNFGGEILLHRNVNILVGYNFGIHQELKLEDAGGSAGLSFGFSARIKSMEFVFSRSTFVAGSAGYAFTLSKDVQRIWKKK